jgi:hypothetical protein
MGITSYDYQNIKEVDSSGLAYIDENGIERYINFAECTKNFAQCVKSSGEFNIENLNVKDTRCIGTRDSFTNPMYFEFFCTPKVRFIFPYKKKFYERLLYFNPSNHYRSFLKLQNLITSLGWSTFDLG